VDDLTRRSIVRDSTPSTTASAVPAVRVIVRSDEEKLTYINTVITWDEARRLWQDLDAIFGGQE